MINVSPVTGFWSVSLLKYSSTTWVNHIELLITQNRSLWECCPVKSTGALAFWVTVWAAGVRMGRSAVPWVIHSWPNTQASTNECASNRAMDVRLDHQILNHNSIWTCHWLCHFVEVIASQCCHGNIKWLQYSFSYDFRWWYLPMRGKCPRQKASLSFW